MFVRYPGTESSEQSGVADKPRLLYSVEYQVRVVFIGLFVCLFVWGGDVSQLVRASDCHAADTGLISWCGKGFFSQSQLLTVGWVA